LNTKYFVTVNFKTECRLCTALVNPLTYHIFANVVLFQKEGSGFLKLGLYEVLHPTQEGTVSRRAYPSAIKRLNKTC